MINDNTTIIPYGIKYKQEYLTGKKAAVQEALKQNFKEDSFKEITLEWNNMDANGHINNVVFFKWLEAGRMSYIQTLPRDKSTTLGDKKVRRKGMIVASVQNSYMKQVHHPDTILVAHKIKAIGNSKLVLESFIYSYLQQAQVGKGETTLVLFDYELQKTYLVPDEWRRILGPDLPQPQQGISKL